MEPISDKFATALRKSHTAIAQCDLFRAGAVVAYNLPIISGTVSDDSQAVIRRRCNIVLPGTNEVLDLLPALAPTTGSLWPLGNEVRLYSGIDYEDGNPPELVPLGVFRIAKPTIADDGTGIIISIDGFDRMRAVSRARFTEPYIVTQGTNYAIAIKNLILSRLPTLDSITDFVYMTTNYTTPQLVFTNQDDPAQMAINMAASIGAELFFDGLGRNVLRPEPNPLTDPSVFSYVEGAEATITSINRNLDDEQAYNGVVVSGETSSIEAPVRGEAWDIDPNSPTYYDPTQPNLSIYGAVPYFITSQYVTTDDQALDAAVGNLARVLGIIEKIDFTAVNNPAHQSGDIITIGRDRINAAGVCVLDSFTLGLATNQGMTGMTRKKRAS